jgi:hypothetical protein
LYLSQQINISWFPDSEIISDRHLPEKFFNDTRKKVVLVDYAFGMLPHDWKYHDLSWVDLVVCLNTEMTNLNFNDSYNKATKDFNNKNVIFILSGIRLEDQSNCIPDRFYFPYLNFFHRVTRANDEISVEYNSARLFNIEALIGSKKYNRVFVFSKLKEFDLYSAVIYVCVAFYEKAYDNVGQEDKAKICSRLFHLEERLSNNMKEKGLPYIPTNIGFSNQMVKAIVVFSICNFFTLMQNTAVTADKMGGFKDMFSMLKSGISTGSITATLYFICWVALIICGIFDIY